MDVGVVGIVGGRQGGVKGKRVYARVVAISVNVVVCGLVEGWECLAFSLGQASE